MDEDPVLQTGEQAAPDPMQAVQSALAYGRQKLGLPAKFYPEEGDQSAQSFDDGGMVDDDFGQDQGVLPSGQPQGGGQGPPDPRATLHYLTGAGALSGEVASALEQQADPDGTMDPAERALRTLSSVSDDKTRFGLLQHYRSKFNAFTAGAKVALTGSQTRPADLGQAAQAATQAFAHVPLGHSIQFAPTAKGIAVMSKPVGGQNQEQSYDEGGEVEDSGDDGGGGDWGGESSESSDPGTGEQGAGDRLPPAEGEDKDRLVSMGGQSITGKDNVEDRRGDNGEGVIFKKDGPHSQDEIKIGSQSNDAPSEEGVIRKQKGRASMLGMQRSFDDGGEVDEDGNDVTAPVTGEGENVPDEVPPEQSKFQVAQPAAPVTPAAEPEKTPVQLTVDQFKKLLDGGYDKLLESGWDKVVNGLLTASGAGVASAGQPGTGADTAPAQPGTGVGSDTEAALAADNEDAPQQFQQAAQEPQVPLPPQRPSNQTVMPKTSQPAPVPTPPPKPAQQMAKDKDTQAMDRLEAQANRLFPWISQGRQRSQYIAHMMEKQGEHENKLEVADKTWGGRGAIEDKKITSREGIAGANRQNKLDIAAMGAKAKMTTTAVHEIMSTLRTNILSSSDMASDVQKQIQFLTPYAQRFGVDPRDLAEQIMSLGQPGGGQQGQQGQARPQSQVGNPGAARAGEERPYTVKGVTKTYVFGTDGVWHKKPEGQAQ